MSTILLNTDSREDIKLISELARKMNINVMKDAREEGLADRKKR